MPDRMNTYLLKSFDDGHTEAIVDRFNFVFNKLKVETELVTIDNLTIDIDSKDFLVLVLDALQLEKLENMAEAKAFFEKAFRNKLNVILVLEELEFSKLPPYLRGFPALQTFPKESLSEEDKQFISTSLMQWVYDIVFYMQDKMHIEKNESYKVFVGPPSDSTGKAYQSLLRELMHRDISVVPDRSDLFNQELHESDYLKKWFAGIDLAVHFIGFEDVVNYPKVESSALKINHLAAEYCKLEHEKSPERLIYIPEENLSLENDLQRKINLFKNETDELENAEIVQMPIEGLKKIVLERLYNKFTVKQSKTDNPASENEVYIMFQAKQSEHVKFLKNALESENIAYCESVFDKNGVLAIQDYQNKLITGKGVIIYYHGDELWLKRKLSDVLKAPGWGRRKAYDFKIVVTGSGVNKPVLNEDIVVLSEDDDKINDRLIKLIAHGK